MLSIFISGLAPAEVDTGRSICCDVVGGSSSFFAVVGKYCARREQDERKLRWILALVAFSSYHSNLMSLPENQESSVTLRKLSFQPAVSTGSDTMSFWRESEWLEPLRFLGGGLLEDDSVSSLVKRSVSLEVLARVSDWNASPPVTLAMPRLGHLGLTEQRLHSRKWASIHIPYRWSPQAAANSNSGDIFLTDDLQRQRYRLDDKILELCASIAILHQGSIERLRWSLVVASIDHLCQESLCV